jgi:serine/threonine-protein kinase
MISSLPYILNNRFELDHELGAGGMGVVYLARDLRLNRPVAIKILRSEYSADAVVLGRFRHEADSAAQLGHPNIVRVYDMGVHEGLSYIVMEYIAGQTLRMVIDEQGALPVRRMHKFATQIAEALAVVHRSGCVHRDIKPQNILLDREVGTVCRIHQCFFTIWTGYIYGPGVD